MSTKEIIAEFHKKFVENKREDGEDFTLYLRDDAIKAFLLSSLNSARADELDKMQTIIVE